MTTTTIPGNDPARILIYGQCPLLTSALSDLLSEQMAGSECVRVHDQEEAMARLHKKAFSLVVIDLDGGDGGVLLLRDVKALEKAPRCIVLITTARNLRSCRPSACRPTASSARSCRCRSSPRS